MISFVSITIGVLIAALFLVFVMPRFWPKTGKMGINFKKTNCPECGVPTPKMRTPKNMKQFLWGGWSCSKCGTEMDKYGVKIGL